MRSETEMKNLILDFAKRDDRVRAVLLNGSLRIN
ncbi:MAG: aminoglycoside 6-adenylyltransferase [Ginsengibacter sp.]